MPLRRSRYQSPPPPLSAERAHGTLGSLRELGTVVLDALEDMCQDTSPFHRVLISQLLVIIVAIELLRPDQADPSLSLLLGLVKVVLVADCASIVTNRIRRLSASNRLLAFLIYRTPLITGPFAELALAMLILRGSTPSTAKRFLIGSVYAKPLVIGALCLMFHGLCTALPGIKMQTIESPITPWLIGVSGITVLVSAPHIESGRQWISQGVPLFLILHVGFSYYFGTWKAATHERRAEDDCVSEQKNNNIIQNREWLLLLVCLGALKIGAVFLVHSLLDHAHTLAVVSTPDNTLLANGAFVEFVALPLAAATMDHLTDIKAARNGDICWSWTNLIQSTLQTYFFVRPLAALAGHDLDPRDGRMGFGLCLLVIAIWLSLPGIPRCSNCYKTKSTHMRGWKCSSKEHCSIRTSTRP
ncbi:hypothetical protein IQ07DRAFT_637652 [Pyrenochaeta sp. DS3sAY3a]|nr:hypothetical protein IQ07DRAFT_637652 [Pyrenochaeta sp. DS3sAY3a]